jgi:hypothetical protein
MSSKETVKAQKTLLSLEDKVASDLLALKSTMMPGKFVRKTTATTKPSSTLLVNKPTNPEPSSTPLVNKPTNRIAVQAKAQARTATQANLEEDKRPKPSQPVQPSQISQPSQPVQPVSQPSQPVQPSQTQPNQTMRLIHIVGLNQECINHVTVPEKDVEASPYAKNVPLMILTQDIQSINQGNKITASIHSVKPLVNVRCSLSNHATQTRMTQAQYAATYHINQVHTNSIDMTSSQVSIRQSTSQTFQPINQPTRQPVSQPVPSTSQPISQLASQPPSQSSSSPEPILTEAEKVRAATQRQVLKEISSYKFALQDYSFRMACEVVPYLQGDTPASIANNLMTSATEFKEMFNERHALHIMRSINPQSTHDSFDIECSDHLGIFSNHSLFTIDTMMENRLANLNVSNLALIQEREQTPCKNIPCTCEKYKDVRDPRILSYSRGAITTHFMYNIIISDRSYNFGCVDINITMPHGSIERWRFTGIFKNSCFLYGQASSLDYTICRRGYFIHTFILGIGIKMWAFPESTNINYHMGYFTNNHLMVGIRHNNTLHSRGTFTNKDDRTTLTRGIELHSTSKKICHYFRPQNVPYNRKDPDLLKLANGIYIIGIIDWNKYDQIDELSDCALHYQDIVLEGIIMDRMRTKIYVPRKFK